MAPDALGAIIQNTKMRESKIGHTSSLDLKTSQTPWVKEAILDTGQAFNSKAYYIFHTFQWQSKSSHFHKPLAKQQQATGVGE